MTYRSLSLVLWLLAWPGAGRAVHAQLTEQEQRLPSRQAAEEEARTLFEAAQRLEEKGELTSARLLYRDIVERFDGTLAAARALERLSAIEGRPDWGPGLPPARERPPGGPPAARTGPDQSGRIPVIVQSTLLTTWLGLAIPIAAEADETTPYGIGLLLGAPSGLLASIYATRDRKVTATQSDVFHQASRLGLWHGLALGFIYDWQGEDVALASALGGVAGAGAGTLLILPGRNRESSAAVTGLASSFGTWLGLVGSQVFDDEESFDDDEDEVVAAMLASGDVALAASVFTMRNITLSRARSRLIGLSGALGAGLGGAIDLIFQIDEKNEAWALVGIGTLGGLMAGVALTADYDTDRSFIDRPGAERVAPGVEPEFSFNPLRIAPRLDASRRLGIGLVMLSARF